MAKPKDGTAKAPRHPKNDDKLFYINGLIGSLLRTQARAGTKSEKVWLRMPERCSWNTPPLAV